jgi:vacuolar iron transporter family protein
MQNDKNSTDNHKQVSSSAMLNMLRASVLGANDGIVSVSALVMGVAGATGNRSSIFTAGMAALVAGALSMAVGEYVSVSSQSDAEKEFIRKEKRALKGDPAGQLKSLATAYEERGVSSKVALLVAQDLTKHDALKAHLQMKFNLDQDEISSPLAAAIASLISFSAGGSIPFLTIIFAPAKYRIIATGIAVAASLTLTGYFSAKAVDAPKKQAILRIVFGGIIAMLVTYNIGKLFGTSV